MKIFSVLLEANYGNYSYYYTTKYSICQCFVRIQFQHRRSLVSLNPSAYCDNQMHHRLLAVTGKNLHHPGHNHQRISFCLKGLSGPGCGLHRLIDGACSHSLQFHPATSKDFFDQSLSQNRNFDILAHSNNLAASLLRQYPRLWLKRVESVVSRLSVDKR